MKRILVVEDEPFLLDMMVEFCEDIGVSAVPAENGAQALEKILSEKPDAALVDNRLPDMLGIQIIEKLKADESTRQIPLILLSGDAKAVENEARAKGAHGVLLKPITRAVLREALESCLGAL
jgi:CheY-like chemotaxis protein